MERLENIINRFTLGFTNIFQKIFANMDFDSFLAQLESLGEAEVESQQIGELIIEGLRTLDAVAYVRFASVYRDFREARDFNVLIDELEGVGDPETNNADDL